jgi:hypothetical protein
MGCQTVYGIEQQSCVDQYNGTMYGCQSGYDGGMQGCNSQNMACINGCSNCQNAPAKPTKVNYDQLMREFLRI